MTVLLPAFLVLLLDQVTKSLAFGELVGAPWIEPGRNHDLALGLVGASAQAELLAGAIGLMLAWRVMTRRLPSDAGRLAFGLVAGGCAGNLLDRAAGGAVRDFLVGPGILFNVADIALAVGLVGMLVVRLPLGRAWSAPATVRPR